MANRALDLTGKKFGKLTAVRIVTRKPRIIWLCTCECGGTKEVQASLIANGSVKSCGCLLRGVKDTWKDAIGINLNGWECLEYVKSTNAGHVFRWRHVCGKEIVKSICCVRLNRGTTCACNPGKRSGKAAKFHVGTRLTQKAMIARCSDPTHVAYERYGGRGISFDPRWVDYTEFVKDMGERPDGCELDRKDNSKGYYKENCRWVTRSTNLRNTSSNRKFHHEGRELCVAEIAEMAEIPYARAYTRLTKYGFNVAQTLRGYK